MLQKIFLKVIGVLKILEKIKLKDVHKTIMRIVHSIICLEVTLFFMSFIPFY